MIRCSSCLQFFDNTVTKVCVLPCQHFICLDCFTHILSKTKKECPFCTTKFQGSSDVVFQLNVEISPEPSDANTPLLVIPQTPKVVKGSDSAKKPKYS
mmetsp:Transcript_19628/g.16769  ORF Transcript_19628/g.16769 Transcript_19628/m.16769 type:complete len:98 (+) Transcript_19628:67-360(+)